MSAKTLWMAGAALAFVMSAMGALLALFLAVADNSVAALVIAYPLYKACGASLFVGLKILREAHV